MFFHIEKIQIELTEDLYGIRLKTATDDLPLPGQTIAETMETVRINFETVQEKYKKSATDKIDMDELNEVCLKIVLHYFYLYNTWKETNEKEKDRDLAFLPKDFSHPYTFDIVIQYFKNKYPTDYAGKCAAMLDMQVDKLLKYEYDRADFYNAFR